MYIGNKNRINISSSQFADFIDNGNLYVDKTMFIEHVLQDASDVLLFTRPRRMGKSLNMNTLATFLDCKKETAHLFKGLYIENSPIFYQINKTPVIYLSFRELDIPDYKWRFKHNLMEITNRYLKEEQYIPTLSEYFNNNENNNTGALLDLTKNLYSVYGVKPYIIIDEYDKPMMDNIHSPDISELKKWITNIFGLALKDNPSLGKAVLTGVTRIAKENMFSGLNNLKVYDLLHASVYDTDFSLTESELTELLPKEKIEGARKWYNNMRVGKELLYNIYSVMNYLSDIEAGLKGYWSMTGGEHLLASLLTDSRAETITRMLDRGKYYYDTKLDYQINMEYLKNIAQCNDILFYTLAVQAGYLSFQQTDPDGFKVFIPNEEARRVWARLVLDIQYNSADNRLYNIFAGIDDVDTFSRQLTDFTSMVLSYNDFKAQDEWVYHVFFMGLVYSLGYECKSNIEAGLGRFDIMIQSRKFCAIIEFKTSKSPDNAALEKEVEEAIKQIDDKEYWYELKNSPLPLYKIGIACHGKKCLVKNILHNQKNKQKIHRRSRWYFICGQSPILLATP